MQNLSTGIHGVVPLSEVRLVDRMFTSPLTQPMFAYLFFLLLPRHTFMRHKKRRQRIPQTSEGQALRFSIFVSFAILIRRTEPRSLLGMAKTLEKYFFAQGPPLFLRNQISPRRLGGLAENRCVYIPVTAFFPNMSCGKSLSANACFRKEVRKQEIPELKSS